MTTDLLVPSMLEDITQNFCVICY